MVANIENNNSTSVWKRAFDFVQAMEEASENTPAERVIVDLSQKVSELEDTIRNLKHVASNQPHLMESNQFTRLGAVRHAILVSGQRCNAADGLIWPTEGRSVVLAGLR